MVSHLVVGLGEVGSAVRAVLSEKFDVDGYDEKQGGQLSPPYDRVHICFPWSDQFIRDVFSFTEALRPGGCFVVHSTVPLGSCAAVETETNHPVVHSPIRGKHPHLLHSLRVFPKWFGGDNARIIADEFIDCRVAVRVTPSCETTEAMKLWDTTQYAWSIVLEKMIHRYCETHGLNIDEVYAEPNAEYNAAYREMGHPEFSRYVLQHMPGPIGGHCVMQNLELLFDSMQAVDRTMDPIMIIRKALDTIEGTVTR